jgi:hypothetical protein
MLVTNGTQPWRAGTWVEVKHPSEIAETLDDDGTLGGLPFMPEMLPYCGRRFQVERYAEKTCLELGKGIYGTHAFTERDVVLLRGLRCSGDDHDGCQRRCMLFWRTAWLRRVEAARSSEVPADDHALNALRSRLRTTTGPRRYFCQSTQLAKVTSPVPVQRPQTLSQVWCDLRSGAVGPLRMFLLIVVPLGRNLRNIYFRRPRLRGTLSRTPVGELNLRPGELVEVRSLEEMRATLDKNGRNRGLICDLELKQFCGRRYRVLGRLDRMISEATAEMRAVQGTVILDGNLCLCSWAVGGCPRREFCYWREVWLKRVSD